MKIPDLSKREKIIFIFLVVVTAVFLLKFFFKEVETKNDSLEVQIERAAIALKKNRKILQSGQSIGTVYEQTIEPFRQRNSDEAEMSNILSQIESLANELNVRIDDMKPQKIKSDNFFKNFAISISTEAGMNKLMQFFYRLETLPFGFTIKELKIEKKSDLDNSALICRFVLFKRFVNKD